MSNYVNDINKKYNIENNQINFVAIKSMINVLIKNNEAYLSNQKLMINEDILKIFIELYREFQYFFDLNYNRKSDFLLFFTALYNSIKNNEIINFDALFCPGYSKNGYKDNLGVTTKWKLKLLKDMSLFMHSRNILNNITCYYSDVFLENTNYELEPQWHEQLLLNMNAFHKEGKKYFDNNQILNMSQLPIFSSEKSIGGYVDSDIIKKIPLSTYKAFKKCNQRFYDKMDLCQVFRHNFSNSLNYCI